MGKRDAEKVKWKFLIPGTVNSQVMDMILDRICVKN